MNSLYTNPDITAGYFRLMKQLSEASQSHVQPDTATADSETFFEELVQRVYTSIQDISSQPLPELHLHTWHGERDTSARLDAETSFADSRGVHIGLGFVAKLDAAILVLSAYLLKNYLWQISPLVLEPSQVDGLPSIDDMLLTLYTDSLPSISEVVHIDDFPAEALSLHSAHLIPGVEARDGYQKRPFQLIMEHLQEARSAADHGDGDTRVLARAIPKPPLDLTEFFEGFNPDMAIQAYLDPDYGPYLLRLHLQLLLDGLYFLLAHEVEHHRLGHLHNRNVLIAQKREEEAEADLASLALLRGVPDFQPRSLIIIFNFARSEEPEEPPDEIDHPLAHNRLLILAKTLCAGPDGDALRADVNSGLALITSRFEPQYLAIGWPNETPEDVDIYISNYSDMDFTAHLMVYINRFPSHSKYEDGYKENAFILANIAYKILFEVRNRIDPEIVYAWGGAGYHPTIRTEDLFNANRAETVFSRLHISIPAPPEFCLKWPDAEFAIKEIEIMYRPPDLRTREEGRNSIRFFYEPLELDLSDFLKNQSSMGQDATLRNRLLMAARRYSNYGRSNESVQIYQYLYHQDHESLHYGDLVDLTTQLMDLDRIVEAAEIARWALGTGHTQRPGFHYVLAMYHAMRDEAQEAFEEMFLEMTLFGVYGELFDTAQEMCGKIASFPGDRIMAALRNFMTHRDAAGRSLQQGNREQALVEFRKGRDALLAGQSQARRKFVFLRQLLSDVELMISELEEKSYDTAMEAAQAVLAIRPDFVPALMNLARINLLQGDRKAAFKIWQQAYAIAPFHNIVFEKRGEFEYGLS